MISDSSRFTLTLGDIRCLIQFAPFARSWDGLSQWLFLISTTDVGPNRRVLKWFRLRLQKPRVRVNYKALCGPTGILLTSHVTGQNYFFYAVRRTFSNFYSRKNMARITCVRSKHNHYFDNLLVWQCNTERLADTSLWTMSRITSHLREVYHVWNKWCSE